MGEEAGDGSSSALAVVSGEHEDGYLGLRKSSPDLQEPRLPTDEHHARWLRSRHLKPPCQRPGGPP